MTSPVIQTVPLGPPPWPTLDPFLFCVHHDDAYPAANDRLGPAVPIDDRDLGQDFSALDGWNMYHGEIVPGFPGHPHRGFETVTYVRRGLIDHADSLGATARFGRGDVQWLTAGRGVVHSEMFPLLDTAGPNPLELFQIWLNLPAADKLVDPYFTMLWDAAIPRLVTADDEGRAGEVTVIAGELAGLRPPALPPDSWASKPGSDLAIWHIHLDDGARWTLPRAASDETARTLYVFAGTSMVVDDQELASPSAAVLAGGSDVALRGGTGGAEALLLQGRPLREPVARYGPFVMNTDDEIRQAFADYRETGFGGWPWPTSDPHHGPDRARFARHADGREEEAPVR